MRLAGFGLLAKWFVLGFGFGDERARLGCFWGSKF